MGSYLDYLRIMNNAPPPIPKDVEKRLKSFLDDATFVEFLEALYAAAKKPIQDIFDMRAIMEQTDALQRRIDSVEKKFDDIGPLKEIIYEKDHCRDFLLRSHSIIHKIPVSKEQAIKVLAWVLAETFPQIQKKKEEKKILEVFDISLHPCLHNTSAAKELQKNLGDLLQKKLGNDPEFKLGIQQILLTFTDKIDSTVGPTDFMLQSFKFGVLHIISACKKHLDSSEEIIKASEYLQKYTKSDIRNLYSNFLENAFPHMSSSGFSFEEALLNRVLHATRLIVEDTEKKEKVKTEKKDIHVGKSGHALLPKEVSDSISTLRNTMLTDMEHQTK